MLALLALAAQAPRAVGVAAAVDTVPGMPPVTDPTNLYSETAPAS